MSLKKQEIEILISPDGNSVKIHVKGIKGSKCLDATEFLEKGLGNNVVERKYTSEYHEVPEKKVTNIGFNRT